MWSRTTAAVIVLGGALAPVLATGGAAAHPSEAAATIACVHASIGGKRTCLAPGRSCKLKYQHQYEHHGFECVKRHGEYTLVNAQQQQG